MRQILSTTRFLNVALAVVFFAAVAAPASASRKVPTVPGKYEDWGPDIDHIEIVQTFRAADYSRLQVETLDGSRAALPEDRDVQDKFRNVLAVATKPFIDGMHDRLASMPIEEGSGAHAHGTLIVRGRILVMDPGSRGKRMFVGYGAGAALTELEVELVDAASGKVLVRIRQERRSGVERFGRGSSYEEIMKRNLQAIGQDVADALKQF